MKDEGVGYVKDFTTCKGGENLTEDDKKEISEEFTERWGGK